MSATISPVELQTLHQNGRTIDLIDVRTPAEFQELHVRFARNVPLDRLDPQAIREARSNAADEPLYVICRSGSRGKMACDKLSAAGLSNVVNVEGGTLACEAAGLPLVKGKKAMSLERQVRIAAGALVVLGSALGFWVHPYCIGIAAFVGAGLMFAGITDTCAMGMLIARMPWNQAGGGTSSTGAACKVSAILLALGLAYPAAAPAQDHTRDSLAVVQQALAEKKAVLVDVREKGEWDKGHLRDARLVPLSVLEQAAGKDEPARSLPKDKVIYLHCAAGGRCLQAAAILKKQGYDARPLKQGFDVMLNAGFPAAR